MIMRVAGLELVLLGHEGRRRRVQAADDDVDVGRQRGDHRRARDAARRRPGRGPRTGSRSAPSGRPRAARTRTPSRSRSCRRHRAGPRRGRGSRSPRPPARRRPRSRTRAETRLSIASPYFRLSHPMPPPRVSPPMPVWLTRPTGTASPCSCVAASRSPSSAPPPTFARRAAGSTVTWFIRLRSMTRPSSTTHEPDMLWAPQRTATSRPFSAANRTAACTSDSSAHMATASGRRSMAAFQTRRASSYVGSPAPTTSPRIGRGDRRSGRWRSGSWRASLGARGGASL